MATQNTEPSNIVLHDKWLGLVYTQNFCKLHDQKQGMSHKCYAIRQLCGHEAGNASSFKTWISPAILSNNVHVQNNI